MAALIGTRLLVVATLAIGLACAERETADGLPARLAPSVTSDRGADLGPDDASIGAVRVSVDTGIANGAGTDNPVLVWINNQRYEITDDPARAFEPGGTVAGMLLGPGLPRTLGELRRSSIVLALDLGRAEIAASWYCDRAAVEVRLEGEEAYRPYLESRDVGWLSLDEPPRRAPAYALQ